MNFYQISSENLQFLLEFSEAMFNFPLAVLQFEGESENWFNYVYLMMVENNNTNITWCGLFCDDR